MDRGTVHQPSIRTPTLEFVNGFTNPSPKLNRRNANPDPNHRSIVPTLHIAIAIARIISASVLIHPPRFSSYDAHTLSLSRRHCPACIIVDSLHLSGASADPEDVTEPKAAPRRTKVHGPELPDSALHHLRASGFADAKHRFDLVRVK